MLRVLFSLIRMSPGRTSQVSAFCPGHLWSAHGVRSAFCQDHGHPEVYGTQSPLPHPGAGEVV